MPSHRELRRLLRPAALCAGLLAASAVQAALPAGCDLHWQLSPQREAVPPQVQVTLTLDAGNRSRTELQLPEGSEVALLAGNEGPNLDPVPGRPGSRSVAHRPGEQLTLRFVVMPGPGTWLRMAPGSLLFAAPALLPLPVDPAGARGNVAMCVSIDGLADSDLLLANQGQATSTEGSGGRVLRLQGPPALARDWMVAAGALQQAERRAEGQALHVVMPAATPTSFDANALADAAARQTALLRRFWADGEAADQWLMLLPAPADAAPRGLALRQALLLQAPASLPLPGIEIDRLLLQTSLQGWFRERFGPVAYDTRPDDPTNQWFTLGFATFYTQRLLSANAQQSLQAHAAALTALLQPSAVAPAAAPWLAMRWHTALREQGQPGLDALLKRQLVPAAQARPTGPLSSPLATHKLQASLRHVLADAPTRDLQQLVERGGQAGLTPKMLGPKAPSPQAPGPQTLGPQTLGPCFRLDADAQQVLPAGDGEPSAACQAWLSGAAPAHSTAAAPVRGTGTGTAAAKGKGRSAVKAAAAKGKPGPAKSSKSAKKGKRARH